MQYQIFKNKVKIKDFAISLTLEDPEMQEFFNPKERLTFADNIIMYCFQSTGTWNCYTTKTDKKINEYLDAANKGVSAMLSRICQTIY